MVMRFSKRTGRIGDYGLERKVRGVEESKEVLRMHDFFHTWSSYWLQIHLKRFPNRNELHHDYSD